MEIKVASTAGFCFGVQRAVDKVYELMETETKPIYTLGPIIHNEHVVAEFSRGGVRAIDESDIETVPKGIVVIRSHGVGRQSYTRIQEAGHQLVDATCPFVLKIHRIVERESGRGKHIIVIGDSSHPEVQGICGWCSSNNVTCMESIEEAAAFAPMEHTLYCVVSQTTFNSNKFKDIVAILMKKRYDDRVYNSESCSIINTICNATEKRQREARQIAAAADTMLVIGSRNSSNTQKLFEICSSECSNTYYIQTPVDLDSDMFQCSSYVGITAGASTPKSIIEEVQKHVRENI